MPWRRDCPLPTPSSLAPEQKALHCFGNTSTFHAQLKMNTAERKMMNDKLFLADVSYKKDHDVVKQV